MNAVLDQVRAKIAEREAHASESLRRAPSQCLGQAAAE
jgi:hypothetical protein